MSYAGLLIGFYGYIFPGNINVMFIELYAKQKYLYLIVLLSAALLCESIYLIISLQLVQSLSKSDSIYRLIQYFSLGIIFIMGVWMLTENRENKKKIARNTLYRGMLSMIIHPQQIPFWCIIGILIHAKKYFNTFNTSFYFFILANAFGALLAFLLYMISGKKLLRYFNLNISVVNKSVGIVYMIMFVYGIIMINN